MKRIWMDYGGIHAERENDTRLIALHYVLGNRQDLTLTGVSANDVDTCAVLEKTLRQAGMESPVSVTQAMGRLKDAPEPCALLAMGGTDILEDTAVCANLSEIVLVGCDELLAADVLHLDAPGTVLFQESQTLFITIGKMQQQATCCCASSSSDAPDFADLGLTAAMYLVHPGWFAPMHRDGVQGTYPFVQHMSEAIEEHVCKSLPQMRMMEENCPCQGAYLDKLVKPAVLVILSDGPSHGFQIMQELERRNLLGGESLDATGLYRMLKHMESAGYLTSRWDTEQAHAKRVFQITPVGRSCLTNWVATLENYRDYVDGMVKQIKQVL